MISQISMLPALCAFHLRRTDKKNTPGVSELQKQFARHSGFRQLNVNYISINFSFGLLLLFIQETETI